MIAPAIEVAATAFLVLVGVASAVAVGDARVVEAARGTGGGSNPVQQALQLLADLKVQLEENHAAAAESHEAYVQRCGRGAVDEVGAERAGGESSGLSADETDEKHGQLVEPEVAPPLMEMEEFWESCGQKQACKPNLARECAAKVLKLAQSLAGVAEAGSVLLAKVAAAERVVYRGTKLLDFDNDRTEVATATVAGATAVHMQAPHIATHANLANFEVVHHVRHVANVTQHAALAVLAQRIAGELRSCAVSREDAFAKVKAMIHDMIARLNVDMGTEDEHKAYCDKEKEEAREKRQRLRHDSTKARSNYSDIDVLTAAAGILKSEIAELEWQAEDLMNTLATIDSVRAKEHEAYNRTRTSLEHGMEGVKIARQLVDRHAQTSSKAAAMGKSLQAMLEMAASTFNDSLAVLNAEELSSLKEHEQVARASKISKATAEQDAKYKGKEVRRLIQTIEELQRDPKSAQGQLDAVFEVAETIRKKCESLPQVYEARTRQHEAAIAGLREVLARLNSEVGLERSYKGLRGLVAQRQA